MMALLTVLYSLCIVEAVSSDVPFSFLGLGDWGGAALGAPYTANVYNVANQLALTALATSPQFLINTGDNFYWCGVQNSTDPLFQTDLIDPYSNASLQIKWYSALGNHEYGYNVDAQIEYMKLNPLWHMPYRHYHERLPLGDSGQFMSLIVLDTSPCVLDYRGSNPEYYDPCSTQYPTCSLFDTNDDFTGPCHFNSNIVSQDCTEQYNWLTNGLKEWVQPGDWLVVVGHHPLDELDVRDFVTPLQKKGMSLYLNGHTHTLNQYTLDNKGAYLTTGAGAMVNTADQDHPTTAAKLKGLNVTHSSASGAAGVVAVSSAHSYQTVFNQAVAGFTTHTFSSDFTSLETQFITYTGQVVHSFTSDRHGNMVSAAQKN